MFHTFPLVTVDLSIISLAEVVILLFCFIIFEMFFSVALKVACFTIPSFNLFFIAKLELLSGDVIIESSLSIFLKLS